MSKIEFTKDFAGKKTGEELKCDGMLASQLVHRDKVAVYIGESLEKHEKGLKAAKAANEAEAKAQKKIKEKKAASIKAEAIAIKKEAKKAEDLLVSKK